MKPETTKPCDSRQELNSTRSTRYAIRRSNVGLKCSSCQRSFPSVVRLRRHLNFVHKNAGRLFCCNKCNITFDDLSVFLQHSRGHKQQEHQNQTSSPALDLPGAFGRGNADLTGNTYDGDLINQGCDLHQQDFDGNEYANLGKDLSRLPEESRVTEASINGTQNLISCLRQSQEPATNIDVPLPMQSNNDVGYNSENTFNNHPSMVELNGQDGLSAGLPPPTEVAQAQLIAKGRNSHRNSRMTKIMRKAAGGKHSNKSQKSLGNFEVIPQEIHNWREAPSNVCSISDSFNIGLPHTVKTLNLMSSSGNDTAQGQAERAEIITYLNTVNKKLDAIIRHFNVPCSESSPSRQSQSESQSANNNSDQGLNAQSKPGSFWEKNSSTPSMVYHATQDRKNSEAVFLSSYNASLDEGLVPKTQEESFHDQSPLESNPAMQFSSETNECCDKKIEIPTEAVEKMRSRSLNRGNFAKHLAFYLFSPEERMGKNCFGRRAGVQSGPKAPLDPRKLEVVKDLSFQYYPCEKDNEESIWRRECVIAIDTGLRGENRTILMKQRSSQAVFAQKQ